MFETLLASNTPSVRWSRSAMAALLLHAGVVIAAVAGTSGSSSAERTLARDTIPLELTLPARLSPSAEQSVPSPAPAVPAPPAVPLAEPEPLRLDLPGVNRSMIDPAQFVRPSLGQGLREAIGGSPRLDSVLAVMDVDRLPELAEDVQPRYPEVLRGSGLSGVVELEYVISSSGRIDRTTMQVRASPHLAFSRAAVDALLAAHFRPALRNGHPVPVRVRQSIKFVIR
jgi:TonB family protein